MNRDMITDTELNNNPLLRKMRERFTCSGNMTIGEIMLHRAERENRNVSTTAFVAQNVKRDVSPAATAVIEEPIKTIESPMRSGRRSLILSCVAVGICAMVLLAFIIPVFGNFGVNAAMDAPQDNGEFVNTSMGEDVPASAPEAVPVEETPVSNFNNIMNSVSRPAR